MGQRAELSRHLGYDKGDRAGHGSGNSRNGTALKHHLASTLGTELSPEMIANVTDAVLEEVKAWQSRPL